MYLSLTTTHRCYHSAAVLARLAVLALAVPAPRTLWLQTLEKGRGLSHGDVRDAANTDLGHSSHQTQQRVTTFDLWVCWCHRLQRRVNQRQMGNSEHGTGLKNRVKPSHRFFFFSQVYNTNTNKCPHSNQQPVTPPLTTVPLPVCT